MLLHASANFRPGALRGVDADVVYLGVGNLGRRPAGFVRAYWDEVVVTTAARRVVLVHWDDFFLGLHRPLRPMPYVMDDLGVTTGRLLPLARRDAVDVVMPSPGSRPPRSQASGEAWPKGQNCSTKYGSTVIQPLPAAPLRRPVEFLARVYQDST
ncbi:hypothetical protein ABZ467_32190 [Streptomyces sp. NPDC005727]|uniref:hypothetical protein n=1 Tax=Streptomyces sp. NPDC005727 TaxID=3157053 RepID=UPI0034088256